MSPQTKYRLFAVAAICFLLLPGVYLLKAERRAADAEPLRTLTAYLKAAYAHDLSKAYRYIASQDRRVKSESAYVNEKGPFRGFTLDVARKLAGRIETRLLESVNEQARTRVKLGVRLPDANSLSTLLLDWEEERLNALPPSAQHQILAAIDQLGRAGKLEIIEGEEEFVLVKEGGAWRVLFDWAAGLRIAFGATVPSTASLEARPLPRETNVKPNELFTVAYRVKNRTGHAITTRIIHRVEPEDLKEHLDIVQCGLLLPVKLPPGKDTEFTSTYMVRGDLPEGAKNLNITYEFQVAE
jgi:hypothetical protein